MNNNIKQYIKTALFTLGSIGASKDRSRMVYYHDVHSDNCYTDMSTTLSVFATHIEIIRNNGFSIVRDFSGKNKEIRVGFDDGFRGIWDNRDFFIENSIFPTIFIPTSLIGKPGYLSITEIIELENLGFNIQSHGVRHTNMAQMPSEVLLDDMTSSKQQLESLLGKTVDEVCFPMGYFNDDVIAAAVKAGYRTLFSSMPDPTRFPQCVYGRLFLQPLTPGQVKKSIRGGQRLLQKHYEKLHYQPDHI